MVNDIKYECYVRYSGRQDWDRPFLSVHDLTKEPSDAFRTKTLDFKRFNPLILRSAGMQDGRINLRDKNLIIPREREQSTDEVKHIDAFLDIEDANLGGWRVFQSLIIPNFPKRNFNEILVAYTERDVLEIYNTLGQRKVGEVEFKDVIPVGEVIPVKMQQNTGIRKILLDNMPDLLKRFNRKRPVEEVNAVFHVRDDIERNYVNLLIGHYS
ncbi:hypothetical protein HYW75_05870 [Candidatus Pacearchaeota archaeon]|nr:hypothetical protein [Candidatus Pacearchaeota archaeon]